MDIYASEEEQVEALKKWWKENWRSIFGGVVLGLGAVFGWRAWVAHTTGVGEQASAHFEQMMSSLQSGRQELAGQQAGVLRSEFESTAYAVFAALAQAKMHLEKGDTANARADLEWVVSRADQPALQQIARLRLGRILLHDGDLAAASALLSNGGKDSFSGEYAELEGDIATAEGRVDAARSAYQRALQQNVGNANLVQIKLDNLSPSDS